MARLPFIDTHVHFWDLNHPKLHYSWLAPRAVHPIIGNIDAIKLPLYGPEEFIAETAGSNVVKVVHVEADVDKTDDPVDETRWLEEGAVRTGVPAAIVADVDLKAIDVEQQIELHMEASPRLRAVRDFSQGDYLVDPDFARGYALLGKHGLICDLDCIAENMGKARDLSRKYPGTVVVLDHAGFPRERTPEYFELWKQGIDAMAEAESAWCKISGLGMCDHDWTVDSIRPWFQYCLEAFGVERCVLATNWPIDRLFSTYAEVLDAYEQIISDLSPDEQMALFSANAERLFDL